MAKKGDTVKPQIMIVLAILMIVGVHIWNKSQAHKRDLSMHGHGSYILCPADSKDWADCQARGHYQGESE